METRSIKRITVELTFHPSVLPAPYDSEKYGGPTYGRERPTHLELATEAGADISGEDARRRLGQPRSVEVPAVRIRDSVTRTDYDVVPTMHGDRIGYSYWAESAWDGPDDNLDARVRHPPLYIASLAWDWMIAHPEGGQVRGRLTFGDIPRPRPTDDRRPDDETLLSEIRAFVAAGIHPRSGLVDLYGRNPSTVDKWLKRARALPGANLPAPSPGRQPRRKSLGD